MLLKNLFVGSLLLAIVGTGESYSPTQLCDNSVAPSLLINLFSSESEFSSHATEFEAAGERCCSSLENSMAFAMKQAGDKIFRTVAIVASRGNIRVPCARQILIKTAVDYQSRESQDLGSSSSGEGDQNDVGTSSNGGDPSNEERNSDSMTQGDAGGTPFILTGPIFGDRQSSQTYTSDGAVVSSDDFQGTDQSQDSGSNSGGQEEATSSMISNVNSQVSINSQP